MTRTSRLALLGLLLVGLAFPSTADAQRRGGGGGGGAVARGGPAGHGGGAVVRGGGAGGGIYRGSNVAVPRTYPPYSHPYYRSYYYRPYYYPHYYYPYYYSPFSFSLSFGFGYYSPYYAYPYYPHPYSYAYPPYPYPYNNMVSTPAPNAYQPAEGSPAARAEDQGEFGTLSIRVTPSDATILIDHQAWDRPSGDDRFSIELVEGPHLVEVRKAGFASYTRTIDVPRGRPLVWNVALTPGGSETLPVARTVPLRGYR